jgi:hypothetical protein
LRGASFATLSKPSSFKTECHALCFGEKLGKLTLRSSPPEAVSSAEPRGKELSSFEEVLVSGGKDMSGDINKGKEISEGFWIGSLVKEVMDFLEYVLAGTRT